MIPTNRPVLLVAGGILIVGLCVGLGFGIAALCGAFSAGSKDLCGSFTVDGKQHKFFVSAKRDVFESLVSGDLHPAVDLWAREQTSTKFKSSTGAVVEVIKNDLVFAGTDKVLFESCDSTTQAIAALKAEIASGYRKPLCGSYELNEKKFQFWSFANNTNNVFESKVVNDYTFFKAADKESSDALLTSTRVIEDCDMDLRDHLMRLDNTMVSCDGSLQSRVSAFFDPLNSLILHPHDAMYRLDGTTCKRVEETYAVLTEVGSASGGAATYLHISELSRFRNQVVTAVKFGATSVEASKLAEISKDGVVTYTTETHQALVDTLIIANKQPTDFNKISRDVWEADLVQDVGRVARAACAEDVVRDFVTNMEIIKNVLSATNSGRLAEFDNFDCQYQCASVTEGTNFFWISKTFHYTQVIEEVSRPFFAVAATKNEDNAVLAIEGSLKVKLPVSINEKFSAVDVTKVMVANVERADCVRVRKVTSDVIKRDKAMKRSNLTCGGNDLDKVKFAVHYEKSQVLIGDKTYIVSDSTCTAST